MKKFVGNLTLTALRPDDPRAAGSRRPQWILESLLTFRSDDFGPILIPPGLVTDFASVPRATRAVIDNDDPWILWPSMPHDYLYSLKGRLPDGRELSRKDCDDIFLEGMRDMNAPAVRRFLAYRAVRDFGWAVWNKHPDPA